MITVKYNTRDGKGNDIVKDVVIKEYPYEETEQTVEYINKRPDFFAPGKTESLDMEKGIISDSVGVYRAYRLPQVIRTIKEGLVTFWAMGHKDEVADLLSYLPAIGKKYSAGYGFVDGFAVEDCGEDYSLWHPDHGLMRPVPVEEGVYQGYPVLDFGIRPPYWKPSNFRRCYVPIR